MVGRKNFDKELALLHKEILLMSSMAEEMLRDSIMALTFRNYNLANEVIKRDEMVDKKEIDIQELIVLTIATQQPVATDLRTITSAFKIITNLERIADHAVNISEVALTLKDDKYFKPLVDIPKLSELVIELVKMAIDSYLNLDISQKERLLELENEIDAFHEDINEELILIMIKNTTTINQASRFILVANYLERIGDHAMNIFESVNYIVTGNYEDFK